MGDLLDNAVDCAALGNYIDSAIGMGGLLAGLFENECRDMLYDLGDRIVEVLLALDATAASDHWGCRVP